MKFDPLSDEQLRERAGTLAPGKGSFQIDEAVEKVSKSSGKPMLALKLRVWDVNGREGIIFDYITEAAVWKIKSLLDSIGRSDMYTKGDVNPAELAGECGDVLIIIEKNPEHGDRAKAKTYLPSQKTKPAPRATPKPANGEPPHFADEDIPF